MKYIIERYHDISCGHRVYNHEGKCKNLHGHNYRFNFFCEAPKLDSIGRVIDFDEIKKRLCNWLEENFDHKMLIWSEDPVFSDLQKIDSTVTSVPFNPTAECLAEYMVKTIGPQQLKDTGITLVKCTVNETSKCSASYIAFTEVL